MKMNEDYSKCFNISFKYTLPFKKYSRSYRLKKDFDELIEDHDISVKDAIDIYVRIALSDLNDNVTKIIKHDAAVNKKGLNCIIDYDENIEIRKKKKKKDFKESKTF